MKTLQKLGGLAALYDRLKSGAATLVQVATVIGVIWAGSLVASGMIANAGIAPVVALYAETHHKLC